MYIFYMFHFILPKETHKAALKRLAKKESLVQGTGEKLIPYPDNEV